MTVLDAPSFVDAQWLFIKFLALNYLFAFASLYVQIKGLYGKHGILPVQGLLGSILRRTNGKIPFWKMPTLFWWGSSDSVLQFTAGLGIFASILILAGVYPAPLFLFLWAAYLSFLTVGSVFLSFQWDILLVEVGFIAIFFSIQSPPPLLMVYLLWFVLFRLLFSSGLVKWLSECPEWGSFTAMKYHYETQPLPNRGGYYFHQFTRKLIKFSDMGVHFFELGVPFLIFTPEPIRYVGFLLCVFFQLLIIATGNYAFFNTLTITLCIPLLENSYWDWLIGGTPEISALAPNIYLSSVLTAIAALLLLWNIFELLGMYMTFGLWEKWSVYAAPFRLVSSYGLFACMTTERNEIIVEGSNDGENWKAYEFKWKPGDPTQAPRQVAPHQPRLDWQMWFAALSNYQYNPWFMRFLEHLLLGTPDVVNLLKSNPFPGAPPKFIRTLFYQYHFTDLKTKRETGMWWTRVLKGLYSPTISLKKQDQVDGFTSFNH